MATLARILAPWRTGLEGLDRRVYVVVGMTLLTVGSRMGVYTFLGIYFTGTLDIPVGLVGLAFLAENLARGLVGPVAGALSDRLGRVRVLALILGLSALVIPGFLLVTNVAGLFAWSVTLGLVQGGIWPVASALLIDLVPPERRQSVLALNYTAIAIGFTAGVVPAGYIVAGGYGALALTASAGFAAAVALILVGLRGHRPTTTRPPEGSLFRDASIAGRDPAFLALAALSFVFPIGIGLTVTALSLYGIDSGLEESSIGLAIALNGPILAFLAIPVNARIGRSGPYRHLPMAAMVCAASYLVVAYVPGFVGILLCVTVFTLGELIFSAALPTAVAQLAPEGRRGAYQGAWGFVFSVGVGSALALTGPLKDALGWRGAWFAWAAVTSAAGLVLLAMRARLRGLADARAAVS